MADVNIKAGDIVELITGSDSMAVGWVTGTDAMCFYWREHQLASCSIPLAALRVVQSAEKTPPQPAR